MLCVFVLGVGTDAPTRYSTIMHSVNSSLFRRSGVRKAEANALSTDPPARWSAIVGPLLRSGGRGAPCVQVFQANRPVKDGALQLRNRTASRLDLLPRAAGETVCGDVQFHGQIAIADGTGPDEVVDPDRSAFWEQLREAGDIHDLILGPERVPEALELGQPHVD